MDASATNTPPPPQNHTQRGTFEERRQRRYERLEALGLFTPVDAPPPPPSQGLPDLSFSANTNVGDGKRIVNTAGATARSNWRERTTDLRSQFEYSGAEGLPEAAIDETILLDYGAVTTFDVSPAKGRLGPQHMKTAPFELAERIVHIPKDDLPTPNIDQDVVLDGGLLTKFHGFPNVGSVKPSIVEDAFATALLECNATIPLTSVLVTRINPQLLDDCKVLKSTAEKLALFEQGSAEANADSQVFRVLYYATVAYTAWTYLPQNVQNKQLEMCSRELDSTNCPLEMEEMAWTTGLVIGLRNAPHTGFNIDETEEELEDFNANGNVRQLYNDVDKDLKYLMTNGCVFFSNQKENNLLDAVRTLMNAKIGVYPKMDMLSKAQMCWPEEIFPSDSPVLVQFMTDHAKFLRAPFDRMEGFNFLRDEEILEAHRRAARNMEEKRRVVTGLPI